jgi:hypothetical protein
MRMAKTRKCSPAKVSGKCSSSRASRRNRAIQPKRRSTTPPGQQPKPCLAAASFTPLQPNAVFLFVHQGKIRHDEGPFFVRIASLGYSLRVIMLPRNPSPSKKFITCSKPNAVSYEKNPLYPAEEGENIFILPVWHSQRREGNFQCHRGKLLSYLGERVLQCLEGTLANLSKQGFQLGEDLLNRSEIRTVSGPWFEDCPDRLNRLADTG